MLSNGQKSYLAQLARRAFDQLRVGQGGADDGIKPDDWRRDQVAKACGKNGLRCCGNLDFRLVEGHFLNLLGESGRAIFVRAQTEPKRQAEAVLLRELGRYGFNIAYAEHICRSKFKCSVTELENPKQVWVLVYDIRRTGQARRKKQTQS